jgi:hypothetical protein
MVPTLVVYPAAEGAQSPNRKTFTGAAGDSMVVAGLSLDDFPTADPTSPAGSLRAECSIDNRNGQLPGQSSRIVIPISAFPSVPPTLSYTPGAFGLDISCLNFKDSGVHLVAYPATGGPNSPDAQAFGAPVGQTTLQATYSRRGNYDVRLG